MNRKTENIVEISMRFQELACQKRLHFPEHYSAVEYLKKYVEEWAEEFEQSFSNGTEDDYREAIQAFAETKFKEMEWLPEEINTQFSYLYRDGSNYKVWNSCIISGKMKENEYEQIKQCCEEELYFIPAEVGLPEQRFSDVTEDDHPWFELVDYEPTLKKPDVDLSVKQLIHNIQAKKGHWDAIYV